MSHQAQPSAPSKVVVLGAGQMGLVASGILAGMASPRSTHPEVESRPRPAVSVWGHSPDEIGQLAQTRTSDRLPGFILPEGVRVALTDRDAMTDAELIVCAVPAQHIRETFARLAPLVPDGCPVVSLSKGIESETLLSPTKIVESVVGARPLGALSGPTIATELARCLPATIIAASDDEQFCATLQQLFGASWLRVYSSSDVVGVEIAGAVKNVVAIAAGILDGLQAGFNAKSALLARGLAEIARLGVALGASQDTFFGIAGVGDLATTCFSPEGRNRSCGEALGKGVKLDDYLKTSRFVVEGVATTKGVIDLADRHEVDMPIARAVSAVLFDGLDPLEAIASLMSREQKAERIG